MLRKKAIPFLRLNLPINNQSRKLHDNNRYWLQQLRLFSIQQQYNLYLSLLIRNPIRVLILAMNFYKVAGLDEI